MPVDVDRANATYGNGIVTLALPKSAGVVRRARRIDIALEPVAVARGEHVGRRGLGDARRI
jgi:hypothetical protein